MKASVTEIMTSTIADELGILYSGKGRKGKKSFHDTNFYEVILGIVHKQYFVL